MQVDDAALEAGQEGRLQHPHESGQHEQVGLAREDRRGVVLLGGAIEFRLVRGGIEEVGRHAVFWPERKDAGVGAVRIDLHHAPAAQLAGLLGLKNGGGVGAASGTEDDDAHAKLGFRFLRPPEFARSDSSC